MDKIYFIIPRETQDPLILMAVTNKIQRAFSSGKNFEAKSAFVATWKDVGYYNMGTDKVRNIYLIIYTMHQILQFQCITLRIYLLINKYLFLLLIFCC